MSEEWLQHYAGWLVAVFAGVTTLIVILRYIFRWFRRASNQIGAVTETLLGRDEIVHPDTGIVLVEATPSLGKRMTLMEDAITNLISTNTEINSLTRRLDSLTVEFTQHMRDVAARMITRQAELDEIKEKIEEKEQ